MSKQEAEDIREMYTQALIGMTDMMDVLIKFTSGGHQDPEIWSTIDEGDLAMIVDMNLEDAQHSAKAAAGVRRVIRVYRRSKVAVVVLPRAWQTMQWYDVHGLDIPLKNPFSQRKRRAKMRVVNADESRDAG